MVRLLSFATLLLALVACSHQDFKPLIKAPAQTRLVQEQGFRQTGRIRLKYRNEGFTGSFLLNAQGDKMRLQVMHSLGGMLVEVFWSKGRVRHWLPGEERVIEAEELYLNGARLKIDQQQLRGLLLGLSQEGKTQDLHQGEGWQGQVLRRRPGRWLQWPAKIKIVGEEIEILLVVQEAALGDFQKIQPSPVPETTLVSGPASIQSPQAP